MPSEPWMVIEDDQEEPKEKDKSDGKFIGKIKQYTEGEETFTAEDAEEEVVIAGIAEVWAAEVNQ